MCKFESSVERVHVTHAAQPQPLHECAFDCCVRDAEQLARSVCLSRRDHAAHGMRDMEVDRSLRLSRRRKQLDQQLLERHVLMSHRPCACAGFCRQHREHRLPLSVSEGRIRCACGEMQKREGSVAWRAPQWLHLARAVGLQLPAALDGAGGDLHEGCLLGWRAFCKHYPAGVEQCWARKRAVHEACLRLAAPAVELLRFQLRDGSAPHIVDDLQTGAVLCPHRQMMLARCKRQLSQCRRRGRLRTCACCVGFVVGQAVADRVHIACSRVRSYMLELH